jgi:hypothetical protein
MLCHGYQRAGSHTKVLAPLSWTVTTPHLDLAQIDHSHQICCRIRVKRPIFVRVTIESRRRKAALKATVCRSVYDGLDAAQTNPSCCPALLLTGPASYSL